jgi:hypothetical protein
MVALVTQTEAFRQLRLNAAALSADEVADVMFKADQASAIIVDYLKLPFDDGPAINPLIFPPSVDQPIWNETTTPTKVKAVILMALTALYDGRTPLDEVLSQPIKDILHRMRDPSMA